MSRLLRCSSQIAAWLHSRVLEVSRFEMSDKKRKLDDLAKDVGEVKSGLEARSRRVERLEKSTCVVVECSSKLEAVYAKAERTRTSGV